MKNNKNKIRVGISVGDTNGIGPEIILKTLNKKGLLEFFTPVIFGSTKLFSYYKNALKLSTNIYGVSKVEGVVDNKINVVNIWKDNLEIDIGVPTDMSGKHAFESLESATKALTDGHVDILVTAPINKENIQSDDFSFPGHTEYLESKFEGDSLMFMIHDELKVGLVTNHIPVNEISKTISSEIIQRKTRLIYKSLVQDFQISKPKIAILGLNPHNSDGGLIGNDEVEKIIPAIEKLKKEDILAFGPFAADSFFGSREYLNYDAVLAMYHDQGLVPFKNITFGEGVNFTAGLNKIRTSPDHGTAYDIVGKNKADVRSFQEAIFEGIKLYNIRKEYFELIQNPLKKQKMEMNYNQYSSNNKGGGTEELKDLE